MRSRSRDTSPASVARDVTGTSALFTLFSGHPLPTWIADPKFHAILEVNEAAQKAYGYSREDFLALTLDEILQGSVIALLAAPADTQKGVPRFAGEWTHRRKDGITIEVAIDAYAADLDGTAVVVMQAKDITGRVTYDRLLARLNECLQSFGPDSLENIDRLTALAGEVLEADSALYNRLEKGFLRAWGQWRVLPDLDLPVPSSGRISADVIAQGAERPFIIRHLGQSPYAVERSQCHAPRAADLYRAGCPHARRIGRRPLRHVYEGLRAETGPDTIPCHHRHGHRRRRGAPHVGRIAAHARGALQDDVRGLASWHSQLGRHRKDHSCQRGVPTNHRIHRARAHPYDIQRFHASG